MNRISLRRALAVLAVCAPCLSAAPAAAEPPLRDVVVVGNNYSGTASVLDPATFQRIGRLNLVPDLEARKQEISQDFTRILVYWFVQTFVGMGNDQLVDDIFPSKDGRMVFASRPSLGDVVAIRVADGSIAWRTRVSGYRSDHMALSPDGGTLLVSASTANWVNAIDTATGAITGGFPSGDQPHENNYSADGKTIFHASIGSVFTAFDEPWMDFLKGDRRFEIVDAQTYKVKRVVRIGERLAQAGQYGYSSAVRPMAIAPDERFVYLQLSFLHGFVEYDMQQDRVTRIATLPLSDASRGVPRDQYLLDSAHHGLAINPAGTKLCAAATMSNYVGIVRRSDFHTTVIPTGKTPYWSTNSADGRYCYVSIADADSVAVVDYATERLVAMVPVDRHPQRIRTGQLRMPPAGT